jgi:N-acetylglutamate synthase-like GNAT family acetyltransferase
MVTNLVASEIIIENLISFSKCISISYQPSKSACLIFSDILNPINNIAIIMPAATLTSEQIDDIILEYQTQQIASFCLFKEADADDHEVEKWLQSKNFHKGSSSAGLTNDLTGQPFKFVIPSEFHPVMVENVQQLNDWSVPFKTAFEYDEQSIVALLPHYAKLINNENLKHFTFYKNIEPVACASIYIHNGVAGFFNLGVLPQYRQAGLGLILQKMRLNFAMENHCKCAVMEAASISEHMAKKLGFKSVTQFNPYYYHFSS